MVAATGRNTTFLWGRREPTQYDRRIFKRQVVPAAIAIAFGFIKIDKHAQAVGIDIEPEGDRVLRPEPDDLLARIELCMNKKGVVASPDPENSGTLQFACAAICKKSIINRYPPDLLIRGNMNILCRPVQYSCTGG